VQAAEDKSAVGDTSFENVFHADEFGHEGVGRAQKDILGAADLFHGSTLNNPDAIRKIKGFAEIMGDHQEGDAEFLVQLFEDTTNVLAKIGIQRRKGFVEEQHRRIGCSVPAPGRPAVFRRRSDSGAGAALWPAGRAGQSSEPPFDWPQAGPA
jgi:hypothetical protein